MNANNIKGNSKTRHDNELKTLNFIRLNSPVSRTDIYEKTDISKPTVTRIIEDLIQRGLIKEIGTAESNAGRKPVNLILVEDAYFCIGVNISRHALSASLVNLSMKIVKTNTLSIKDIKDTNSFLNIVYKTIKDLIDSSKVPHDKILGLGIGAPGVVDFQKGIIKHLSIAHTLQEVPLGPYLENLLQLKVIIDNNANTRAFGEYWYGLGAGYKNIIYVTCNEGVGSGIVVDGNILRGKNNITSGLGHMIVKLDGKKCSCGGSGCIEAYSSIEAIESAAKDSILGGSNSLLLSKIGSKENIDKIDFSLIAQCADNGDSLCTKILCEAAAVLGGGVANLIGIFNPELIIFSGIAFDKSSYFYELVKQNTRQKLFNPLAQDILFTLRKTGDILYEIGAATMIFKDFFCD
jgi:predicted NBD/HSP70 family sugar kinase